MGADVSGLGGDDTLNLLGGTTGTVDGGDGADTILLDGVIVEGDVLGGVGDDTIIMDNRDTRIGTPLDEGAIDGGAGNDTIELLDGLTFFALGGDGDDDILLDGGFVFRYIDAGAGDDNIYWDEGIANEVRGGPGSDTLLIDSFAYDGTALLDGGDDLTSTDGAIDTLTFVLDHEIDGNLLRNWERIVIEGSSKMIFSGTLAVGGGRDGDGNDLGLEIFFGGLVEFVPRNYRISGNVTNAGTLNLQNARYDSLTLSPDSEGRFGNYRGKDGRLWLDARLGGDGAPADLFRVEGNVTGRTLVDIANRGGLGAPTFGDGIRVIQVDGNSPDSAFTLAGDFTTRDATPAIVGGAYAYTLQQGGRDTPEDGDWYLRSTFDSLDADFPGLQVRWQPAAVLYESLPLLLRQLNQPETLRQRVGNRFWMGSSYQDLGNCDFPSSVEQTIDGGGAWIRVRGDYGELAPKISTTRAQWEQDAWRVQTGIDVPLGFTVRGTQPLAGVALHYSESDTDVESFFGNGNIQLENYGTTLFGTWYGNRGAYFDAQIQLNWFEAELDPDDLRPLAEDSEAFGYSLALEGGRTFKLCDYYSATPFAQLVYSSEDIDDIIDDYGVKFSQADNDGWRFQFGSAFEQRISRRKSQRNMFGDRPLERIAFYITPSVNYFYDDVATVDVSGTQLRQEGDNWYGQLALGATYDECGDECSVYGELNLSSSLNNFGDSTTAGLIFGFRFKW
ncbi:autotransporter outer membrane beta-barrel domain-containing protein [Microbulbifer flavimaris]|uniref:Autotransporter outer membrane beta-barrel domain-containing protein n=1 Tax=Microbulbifer flavimaris TaxID=1781068 RepID=A0ABX4HZV8_9GAMM|nr:autotransporter outer membrane beta-barrel domain-containing protein [Microbulbifer flavimaris]